MAKFSSCAFMALVGPMFGVLCPGLVEGYHGIIARQTNPSGLVWYGFNLKHGTRQLVDFSLDTGIDSKGSQCTPYDTAWEP